MRRVAKRKRARGLTAEGAPKEVSQSQLREALVIDLLKVLANARYDKLTVQTGVGALCQVSGRFIIDNKINPAQFLEAASIIVYGMLKTQGELEAAGRVEKEGVGRV